MTQLFSMNCMHVYKADNMPAYLWNCTEVEYTLVVNARHVQQYIRYMLQCISDEIIETVNSCHFVLWQSQILQTSTKLTPSLHSKYRLRQGTVEPL